MCRLAFAHSAAAGLAALAFAGSCTERATYVRVADPGMVALGVSTRGGPREMIPPGRAPARATIAEVAMAGDDGTASLVRVEAAREPDGAIAVECATCEGAEGRRRAVLVGLDGRIRAPGHPDDVLSAATSGGVRIVQVAVPYRVDRAAGRRVEDVQPGQALTRPGGVRVPVVLATPWSNVQEIRQRSPRGAAGALVLAATAVAALGLLAVLYPSSCPGDTAPVSNGAASSDDGSQTGCRARQAGVLLGASGLVVGGAVLFARSSSETIVYPAAGR